VLRGYVAIVHEIEDALCTCQCTLSNVPWSKGVSLVEIRCQMQVYSMVIVLICTLHITGPQNRSFGRKSHGCSFWAADGVIDTVVIEPGTTINSEHCIGTLKTLKQARRVWKHKKFCCNMTMLGLTLCKPTRKQLTPAIYPSWTRICLKWRGRKVCQDLDEETNCGVLLWRPWETCLSLANVWRMVMIMWRSKYRGQDVSF
jgi:hypothetical protein